MKIFLNWNACRPCSLPPIRSVKLTRNSFHRNSCPPFTLWSSRIIKDFGFCRFGGWKCFQSPLRHLSCLIIRSPKASLSLLCALKLPKLKTLDFKRVRPVEVEAALKMFPADGSKLSISNKPMKLFKRTPVVQGNAEIGPFRSASRKYQEGNWAAKTLAEVNRLEKILQKLGSFPMMLTCPIINE